ncbi:MAG TPA: hypothetical protein DEQ28_05565 [Clostridiales bacterium]|nr:hypothetical protein [Clostridiales bacterium]
MSTGDGTFHHGIDIAPPGRTANMEVRSPVTGEVVFTGGEYSMSVRNGQGYLHQLLHLERALVRTGDRVRAGDPVGIMGGHVAARLINQSVHRLSSPYATPPATPSPPRVHAGQSRPGRLVSHPRAAGYH